MSLKNKFLTRMNTVPVRSIIDTEPFGTEIPKIFHQTYPGKELPPLLAQNRANIMAMNPGWDCRLYNNNDIDSFILKNYGEKVLNQYNRINPQYGAAKADFFRYVLLYKVGGVYLDVKAAPTRPFDSMIQAGDRYLLSYWSNNKKDEEYEGFGLHAELGPEGEFQQWMIISAPGHPYLKAVIDTVLQNIDRYFPSLHGVGKQVLQLTGPIAYTHAIKRILHAHPHRFTDSFQDLALKYSIVPKYTHKNLFNTPHYSTLTSPIVKLSAQKSAANVIIGRLNRWKMKLKKRPGNSSQA